MKAFTLPPWRQKVIDRKYKRKYAVTNKAVDEMERVMHHAVHEIIEAGIQTDRFMPPTLNEMFSVSERFYRRVVVAAYESAEDEKAAESKKADTKKRIKLTAPGPMGIPRRFRDLEKIFRDRRYWPKIMERSKKMTNRLRKAYLEKLRKKFDDLIPRLKAGELSPKEAKAQMMEAWSTSKARVETIFRTETTNYFGRTQVAFFSGDPEIIGFLFDSIRDTGRTKWCKSRHGLVYRPGTELLRKNTPALHWRCRSHLIALANTEFNRKMLSDPDRDPEKRKVEPLDPQWRK